MAMSPHYKETGTLEKLLEKLVENTQEGRNLKHIAEKYYGGINIESADDTFKLNIMMMLE